MKNSQIPENREELVQKYTSFKCPLPKRRNKSKAYKVDAAELIALSLRKAWQRVFNHIREFTGQKKRVLQKPPICRSARTRNYSRGSFHEILFEKCEPPGRENVEKWKSCLRALARFVICVENLNKKVKGLIFFEIKENVKEFDKVGVEKGLKGKKTMDDRKFFTDFKQRYLKPEGLNINTPKFLIQLPATKYSDLLKHSLKTSKKPRPCLTPGKIFKTNFSGFSDCSEEPERNPTFGAEDLDNEESLNIEALKAQNSLRSIEIQKSLLLLEESNSKQRQDLNHSKRHSLSSSRGLTEVSSSFDKQGESFPLSRLALKSQVCESLSENFINDEDLSLKSFNQMIQNSSFDKDLSIIKHSNKELAESFDSRLSIRSHLKTETPVKSYSKPESPGAFKRETPSRQGRKKLIKRLEALSKLEDTFTTRFSSIFLEIISEIQQKNAVVCLVKMKKIPLHLFRRTLKIFLSARPRTVVLKAVKGLISCFNCNFLNCKERTLRKWQMKVRLELIRKKEIYLAMSSLVEVVKKHIFTRSYFSFNLIKKIFKKIEIKEFSMKISNKSLTHTLIAILNKKKKVIWNLMRKNSRCQRFCPHDMIAVFWRLWKKVVFFRNQGKVLVISGVVEILKKKCFPVLWNAWKSLKNLSFSQSKVQQKILIKKYIESWMTLSNSKSNKWIHCFYQWKQVQNDEKMTRLKEYKTFFM
jgi:hypothetical protein